MSLKIIENVTDQVEINFDWIPAVQDKRVTFQVRLRRGDQKSAIDFEIDLAILNTEQLERLRDFLAARQAGMTPATRVVSALSWLLDVSFTQAEPQLEPADRQNKVRELLLVSGRLSNERTPPNEQRSR
jgi:hypothetical protein